MGGICSGRPKSPPISTFDPGLTVCSVRPEMRSSRAYSSGSGLLAWVTMFSSFQISQWVIGR